MATSTGSSLSSVLPGSSAAWAIEPSADPQRLLGNGDTMPLPDGSEGSIGSITFAPGEIMSVIAGVHACAVNEGVIAVGDRLYGLT